MARGRTQDVHQSTVLMNGKQADDEMKRLTKRADEFGRKKREAFEKNDLTAYKKWDQSLRGVNKEIRNLKLETKSVEAILKDINGASFEDIRKAANKANRELKQMRQNDPGFKEKSRQAEILNNKYRDMSRQMRGVSKTGKGMFGSLADGFNRYFGMAIAFAASITGMIIGFKKLSEDIAALDDVYSDVMKTTGMTRDEVVDLNEEFKQMDTRAAREQLNMLARDAGKLGITGKKDILDFVDAGNQINVALGEDLGEDAIKQIGKMVGVYKNASTEIKNLDLKGQMLAVGSAINELGAISTASEPYLVQFSGRLGGVAQQAGISMSAILGYASALDQDMQAVEMSATALQNFIMKLMGDPAKFAKLAGLEVKGFTKLLETDANAAIKKVLRSLNEKGGFQQLIPIFQEMGLDGARAVGVLSSMAGGIDKIEEAQITASKAMLEGISITKEYDIKNTNLAAKREKARKAFKEKALELGQRLSSAMLVSTNAMSYMVKVIIVLIEFFEKYGREVLTLAALIAGYTIALKTAAHWEQIHTAYIVTKNAVLKIYSIATGVLTGKIKLATIAQRAWNLAQKANPIGLLVGVLAAAGAALYLYSKRLSAAEKAQRMLNDINVDATKSIVEQKLEVEQLLKVAKSYIKSDEERLEAIKKLNKISPEYLGNLSLENIRTEEATEAKDKYIESLLKEARIKAAQEKLIEVEKKLIDLRMSGAGAELSWNQQIWNQIKSGGNQTLAAANAIKTQISNTQNETETLMAQQKALLSLIDQGEVATSNMGGGTGGDGGTGVSTGGDGGKPEYRNAAGQTFEEWKKANELRQDMLRVLESTVEIKKKIDAEIKEAFEKAWNTDFRTDEESIDDGFVDPMVGLQHLFEQQKAALDENYASTKMTKEAYNEEMELLELAHLNLLLNLRKDLGMETVDVEAQLIDIRIKNKEAEAQKEQEILNDRLQRTKEFAAIYQSTMTGIGDAVVKSMMGDKEGMKNVFKDMLIMWLDYLKKLILIKQTEILAQSLASPESIATFGIAGIAKAAIIVGIVEAAFAGLKGAIGNFYDGGFTGPGAWNKPQGIVHSNEFVANRFATQNPTVRPVLDMIDYAQRSGNISNLNLPAAVAGSAQASGGANGGAPTDKRMTEILDRLEKRLAEPPVAILKANQDYMRTHNQFKEKYDKQISKK